MSFDGVPLFTNVPLEQTINIIIKRIYDKTKRYVDDTICFVNSNCISHVLESLNSFHSNIKFTAEIEKGTKIAFLDILLIRYKDLINTTVYGKKTNTDLYINWKSFSPNNWKWGTLKTLVLRAYHICSTEKYLKVELNHIETVDKHQNNYPS